MTNSLSEPGNSAGLVVREDDGGIVRLWMNRPERRNALSLAMLEELGAQLTAIAAQHEARVVIIASQGKVFCSGHDLGEMRAGTEEEYQQLFSTCTRVMQQLRRMPQPVIARVQGLATAAGCQLVAACDLAVAAEEAAFATPGVKIGLFCTTPMVPLVRNIAPKLAMEMLLTGRPITAQQALSAGLVNRVVPADRLDAAVAEFAQAILSSSPMTIALGKQAFYEQLPLDEPTAYCQAVEVMVNNAQHPDAQEGIAAFLEKRPPRWNG